MKLFRMVAAAVAALALTAGTTHARTTPHHRWHEMTVTERRQVVVHDVRVQRSHVRAWLHSHRWLGTADRYPFCRALGTPTPGHVCAHGQRLVHDLALLHRIDARIAAAKARNVRSSVNHYAGWECIHGGEGDGWDPSGSYSGPLQMTPGWAGYPIYDWTTISKDQVYADAEAVAVQHGFSYSWMHGQWPNTFPPCAGYFS